MSLPKDLTDSLVYAPKKLKQERVSSKPPPKKHRSGQAERPLGRDTLTTITYSLVGMCILAQCVLWFIFG